MKENLFTALAPLLRPSTHWGMSNWKYSFLLVFALFSWGAHAGVITPVGTRAGLGANDLLNWGVAADDSSLVASPYSVISVGGLTVTAALTGDLAIYQQNGGTFLGNFTDGEILLDSAFNDGPITLSFGSAIRGVGFNIQRNDFETFTGQIDFYGAGNTLFGTVTQLGLSNDNNDGSAIFICGLSSLRDIVRVDVSVSNIPGNSTAFAINQMSLLTTGDPGPGGNGTGVPEPGTVTLIFGALAGLLWMRWRARPLLKVSPAQMRMKNKGIGPLSLAATALIASFLMADAALAAAPGALLGHWSSLGPSNQGGRTRQLLIDPADTNIMYAAAVGGGVWKSADAGANWTALTDLQLPNIAVASLAMDPKNPQILYAGTGEGFFNFGAIRGGGIFKTTDGGGTWSPLAATVPAGVAGDFSYVSDIVVSSRYSQRVYATTLTGLFRSNDGGVTWTQLINASAVNGCQDIAMQVNRTIGYVFAACGTFATANIYRALDGPATVFSSVFTTANMGRTSLAIAPSNENYVYAMSASNAPSQYQGGLLGVFRSTANGNPGSWTTQVSNTNPNKLNTVLLSNPIFAFLNECFGSSSAFFNQGWYDNVLAVDPVDPNRIWAGGIDLFRSDDGGQNWGIASYWWFGQGDPNYTHHNNHVIRFDPGYNGVSNKKMYVAGDGGVFRTDDARAAVGTTVGNVCGAPAAGMVSWTEINNDYVTTQFNHGSAYPDGDTFFGGIQNNGTWRGTTASTAWQNLLGGDGGHTAVDTKGDAIASNDVLFGAFTGLSIQRSTNGGSTFNDAVSGISESGFGFIAPFFMNPGNRQHLWTGGWYIWRTTNQATSWTRASALTPGNGSVSAITAAPGDTNHVIAGMSDGFLLFNTSALVANSSTVWAFTRPLTAAVSAVTFDPTNPAIAYATYETFSGNSVYRSTNSGATWVAMPGTGANVLPKVPAHTVVVDPTHPTRIYVGTDIGVYTSIDSGANWYREASDFANVRVEHLEINGTGTRRLFAFTHGRGAWRVDLNP